MCHLPQLEEAAKEVADEVTRPRPVEEETVQDIQVMLKSDAHPASIRNLKVWVPLSHHSVAHTFIPVLSVHIFCHMLLVVRCLAGFKPQ